MLLEARPGGVAWGACVPVTPAEEEDGESDGGTLILNGVAMSTAALLPAALTTRRVLSGIVCRSVSHHTTARGAAHHGLRWARPTSVLH